MAASYPTSAKAYTTKNTGDSIQADHINDLQVEVTAMETDLLAGLPVARGGTGAATLTAHAVLIGNGTSAVSAVAPSVAGQVLGDNGSGVDPSFQAFESEARIVALQVFS